MSEDKSSCLTKFRKPKKRPWNTKRKRLKKHTGKELHEQIHKNSECQDGLKKYETAGKRRVIKTTKALNENEFVVEYKGDLNKLDEARREEIYSATNAGFYVLL